MKNSQLLHDLITTSLFSCLDMKPRKDTAALDSTQDWHAAATAKFSNLIVGLVQATHLKRIALVTIEQPETVLQRFQTMATSIADFSVFGPQQTDNLQTKKPVVFKFGCASDLDSTVIPNKTDLLVIDMPSRYNNLAYFQNVIAKFDFKIALLNGIQIQEQQDMSWTAKIAPHFLLGSSIVKGLTDPGDDVLVLATAAFIEQQNSKVSKQIETFDPHIESIADKIYEYLPAREIPRKLASTESTIAKSNAQPFSWSNLFGSKAKLQAVAQVEVTALGTMMRAEELGLLHRIAKKHFTGHGVIVDAGTFIGASAIAFAKGLSERADRKDHYKTVYSYDLFVNNSPFFDPYFKDSHPRNTSFIDVCLDNIKDFHSYINVFPGDFCREKWNGKPIEVFFCDLAKSPQLNAHVYAEFEPYWIVGTTLYVQQDFVHLNAPWIQYSLGSIIDCFSIVAVESPSLVLVHKKRIDQKRLARIIADDFSLAEKIANVEALIQVLGDAEAKATMQLLQVRLLFEEGEAARARQLFETIQATNQTLSAKTFQSRIRQIKKLLTSKP